MTETLAEGRPLHLLKNSECRFPLTSPARHEPHVFCGSPAIDGKPYCAAHLKPATHFNTRRMTRAACRPKQIKASAVMDCYGFTTYIDGIALINHYAL